MVISDLLYFVEGLNRKYMSKDVMEQLRIIPKDFPVAGAAAIKEKPAGEPASMDRLKKSPSGEPASMDHLKRSPASEPASMDRSKKPRPQGGPPS